MADRKLIVQIVGDERDLQRSFRNASRGADHLNRDFGRLTRGAIVGTGALHSLGRAAAFASASFIGGAGIVAGIKASSVAASNLAEQTSKANKVFGDSTKVVRAYANDALGLAADEALSTASSFGALLTAMGVQRGEAAKLSVQLSQLGVDFASLSNLPTADALAAIRSGLVGESEPLRRFNVLLTESRVQQEALSESGKKSVKALTEQDKVIARLNLILRQGRPAVGDYADTIGGLANQQRELQKNVRNVEIAIGKALNPAILDITKSLNVWFSDTKNVERVQRDVNEAVKTAREVFRDVSGVVKTAADAVGGFKNLVELLLALKVASVLANWTTALRTLIGTEAAAGTATGLAGAAGAAGLLRTRLLRLAKIGPIAIPITLFFAEKTGTDKSVSDTLHDLVHGNLTNALIGRPGQRGKLGDLLFGTGITKPTPDTGFRAAANLFPATDRGFRSKAFKKELERLAREGGGDGGAGGSRFTPTQRNTWFDAFIGRREDRVQDIASLRGQAAELSNIAAKISAEIARVHDQTRKLTLGDDLVQVMRQRRDILEQLAVEATENAAKLRDARQFGALGLGPTGDAKVPGLKALRNVLGNVSEGIVGTFLDTKKTHSLLSGIRRVLSGGLGTVSAEVRSKVQQILGDFDRQLKDHETKTTSRRRHFDSSVLLAGLGLSPDQIREARLRLAQISPGGTVPNRTGAFALAGGSTYVMHNPQFHGVTDIKALEEKLRRRNLQRAKARRGPYAGRN